MTRILEQIIKFISKNFSRRHKVHKEHGGIHGINKFFVFLCGLCVLRASVRNIGSIVYDVKEY